VTGRLIKILEIIELNNAMSVAELALKFVVSEETIRRDIKQLESSGRVVKVHGGVRLSSALLEPPYRKRVSLNAEAKKAIGIKAAELVQDGMTVFIDSGSTSYWLSKVLKQPKKLLIITNSLEVASEVVGRQGWKLVIIGGQVDMDYRAAFGQEAIAHARRFTPDLLFLSIGGIDKNTGLLDFSIEEADFKRSLIDRARHSVLLADVSKFDAAGSIHLADFSSIDTIICDQQPDLDICKVLEKAKVDLLTVN
jgi:DeoR family glycerol-3-phosphate regulon repressor